MIAINFHRPGKALRGETVGLTRHSQRKAQPLLTRQRSYSTSENSSGYLKPRKADSSSFNKAIRLAQLGDAEAFEIVYQHHCGRVYALCLRMLRDPIEAEDLVQEVFVQLFRKIHTFRGESAFSTWLHRLTANLVLMHLRRKKPISISLDEITGSEEEDIRLRQEIGGPDPRLSGLLDRINIQSAIDQLPEGYKQMFVLHDVQGYEHSEIAKILGRSIGNSKSQLHKARKRLRELLEAAPAFGARHRETTNSLAPAGSY
jgi:RNA polymerase sigma-70 factor, ECF subfamily